MKNIFLLFLTFSLPLNAQEISNDSIKIQNLEEVVVSSIRVQDNIPIAFNNMSKDEI